VKVSQMGLFGHGGRGLRRGAEAGSFVKAERGEKSMP
jgi:hypothetical protein